MSANKKIPIIPGRGLISESAMQLRQEYLKNLGYSIHHISHHGFTQNQVLNNIESFVGSTEIPLGLVGPLLNKTEDELLYCVAGTLEGAMVASMNRGARAISNSGGFSAEFIHQKMTRVPLFLLKTLQDALIFKKWVEIHFHKIKEIAESPSNHAVLTSLQAIVIGKSVHLKFIYTTGDASGQNMTTTCTWHAMLWIVDNFQKEENITIEHFIIEGNGASDKKISNSLMLEGRGIMVIAECFLSEHEIMKVLRSSSDEILRYYSSSIAMSQINGMIGYNINVANAIAAIFIATGQDLGSLHESSSGILNLEKQKDGLYISLMLPSLVIGTVGGGTQLPKQQEALKIMKCNGTGKVKRFAKMIAGFSMALEISTYAAIVSGEFAKAHEKLGRNKPVNWLNKSNINIEFIKNSLIDNSKEIISVEINTNSMIENGILTDITKRVNKKLIGFIPLTIQYKNNEKKQILIKSKALDIEVIKGLHIMAASINTDLADLIYRYKNNLEYASLHQKEIVLYESLNKEGFDCIPEYLGKHINKKNETWLFMQEFLYNNDMELYNTEQSPEKWKEQHIKNTIKAISAVHKKYRLNNEIKKFEIIQKFEPWKSVELYKKFLSILIQDTDDKIQKKEFATILSFVDELKNERTQLKIPETIIHNDFNSRNIAIRKNGKVCIYDWELAVINIPHRDIVELLSFVLKEDFTKNELNNYLRYHHSFYKEIEWLQWKKAYIYAIKEYLVTRVSFYKLSSILIKFPFTDRIHKVSLKILKILSEQEN